MARDQRDDKPFLQAFQKWMRKKHALGNDDHAATSTGLEDFIPDGAVHEYLKAENRYKSILRELFGEDLVIGTRVLLERYSKVFAILVKLGKGHFISSFLKHEELGDDRLPFSEKPAAFPDTAEDFFDAFHSAQFRFCAAVFDNRLQHEFSNGRILPFLEKREIASGGSSVVYKIKIHGMHAIGRKFQDTSASRNEPRYYALKKYRGQNARELHDYEVDAFVRFRKTGIEAWHMVGFLCSFTHRGAYYAVLELADLGTLESYMQLNPPPSTDSEVIMFWANFLQIAKPIVRIHDIPDPTQTGASIGYICHQDIKPGNILVKRRPGATDDYDCAFGLADFGSSRFHSSSARNKSLESFATSTYGAPETSRESDFEDVRDIAVTPAADIWSFAAMLSEVCVWVMFGMLATHGVEGYRDRRRKATGRTTRGPECFHSGNKVLQAVNDEHAKLLRERRCDSITRGILQLMPDLLHPEPEQRIRAVRLNRKLEELVKEARLEYGIVASPTTPPSRSTSAPYPSHQQASPRPRIFGHIGNRRNRTSSTQPSTHEQETEQSENEHWVDPSVFHSPRTWTTVAAEDDASCSIPVSADNVSAALSDLSVERPNTLSSSKANGKRRATSEHMVLHSSPPSIDQPTFGDSTQDPKSPTSSHSGRPDTGNSTRFRESLSRRNSHADPARFSTGSTRTPVKTSPSSAQTPAATYTTPTPTPSATQPDITKKYAAPAKLSFSEAEHWRIQKRPDRHARGSLPGSECLDQLQGCDIVFVVDDSHSMGELWKQNRSEGAEKPNVKTLLRLLCYLAKSKDDDGVDLYYFHHRDEGLRKVKRSTDVWVSISQRTFLDTTTPTTRLTKLLNDYREKLQRYRIERARYEQGSGKRRLFASSAPQRPKPLSLYVLTDGVWEDDKQLGKPYLDHTIKALVTELEASGCDKNHVGIQFISFGNHQFGIQRLQALDRLAASLNLERDIIDTEPAEGDILKMLLGAINDRYDRLGET